MAEQPRAGLWRAVSSEEQADPEKDSLDYQDRKNREHAAKWNAVIVADMVVDESRNIVLWEDACQRIEAYAQLDDLIKRRAIDILFCMDATRLGRDRALIITAAALCERAGIRIYETSSPPTHIDGPHSTADTRLLLMLKGHIAEEEVRKFSERSLFGRRARIKRGKHNGVPPYGYKRAFDDKGEAYFTIHEERAAVVRLFYDLYLNHGRSLQAICDEFNARGIYSPRSNNPWVPGNIRILLKNCWLYAGYTSWGSSQAKTIPTEEYFRVEAEWQPIISEETARRVAEILYKRTQAPRSINSPYRFSMVCKCGYCGKTITVGERAGTNYSKVHRYVCVDRCLRTRIGEPAIMAEVEAFIIALQDHVFLETLVDATPDYYSILVKQYQEATKEVNDVREQRKRLTVAYTRNTISIEEYETLMAELQARHDDWARAAGDLARQIEATPNADARHSRLEHVRDKGLQMLHHPDTRTANQWLREYIQVIIADYSVAAVQCI